MIKKPVIVYILYAIFVFGFLLHLNPVSRSWMLNLTTITVIAYSVMILISIKPKKDFIRFFSAGTFLLFIFILLDLKFSLFFGNRSFSIMMEPKIMNVPISFILNIMLTLTASFSVSELILDKFQKKESQGKKPKLKSSGNENKVNIFSRNTQFKLLLTSVFTTIFIYLWEIVSLTLNYWFWEKNIIPVTNLLIWFIVVYILSFNIELFKIKIEKIILPHFFYLQLSFFVLLAIFFKLFN